MPNLGGGYFNRGAGDRRPPELLPGYDPDWRDPRDAQIYTLTDLQLADLNPDLLNLANYANLNKWYADRLRLIKPHDVAAAFSLMMELADVHLVSEGSRFVLRSCQKTSGARLSRRRQSPRCVLLRSALEGRASIFGCGRNSSSVLQSRAFCR